MVLVVDSSPDMPGRGVVVRGFDPGAEYKRGSVVYILEKNRKDENGKVSGNISPEGKLIR